MKQNEKVKKRSYKNFNITTRITLSTVAAIAIPLVILIIFSSIFLSTIASYFDFSSVTTNTYSTLNQIQWSQTMSSISNELISDDSDSKKIKSVEEFVSPLEELGSVIYIEQNGETFYSTAKKESVIEKANNIVPIDFSENINYFGENGIVIVSHANADKEKYVVIIANEDYTVNDASKKYSPQDVGSLLFGKTGLIIIIIVALFVVSIIALSFITSRTISKPLQKLAEGADEIANGNLDYVIDYKSTNEIGQTVDSFNKMSRQLKNSLDEQNRMEQSRKEMIAGIAHDLRTPLTSVKGYVEGLMDGIADTPEKQQRYLQTIYSATNDTEKMLDHLLTVSKLELGQVELNSQPTNLNAFLRDCAEDISLELEQQDFDFTFTDNCDNDVMVDLDADRFARVIRNIVSNSVKYTKKDIKGEVRLSVENYEKSVIISISDNGMGVDVKNLNRIFDSFYRADKARSKSGEGSGIGLFVCKQIVELHGGHIWAMGKEGEGLTIHISLNKRSDLDEEKNTDC